MNTPDIVLALKLSKKGQLKYKSGSKITDILGEARDCDGVISNHGSFNRESSPMRSKNRSLDETAIELKHFSNLPSPNKNDSSSFSDSTKISFSGPSLTSAAIKPPPCEYYVEKQPMRIQNLWNSNVQMADDSNENCHDLEQYTRFTQLKARIESRHRRRTFDMKLKQINDDFEKEILLLDDKIVDYHVSKYESVESSLSNILAEENERLEKLKQTHGIRTERARTTIQKVAAVKNEMIEAEEQAIAEEKERTNLLKNMSLICKEGLTERVNLIEKIKTSKYSKSLPRDNLIEVKDKLVIFEKCLSGTNLNEKTTTELQSHCELIKQSINGIKTVGSKILTILKEAEKEELKTQSEAAAKIVVNTTVNTVTPPIVLPVSGAQQNQTIAAGVFGSVHGLQSYENAINYLKNHQEPFAGISTSNDTVKRQYRHQLLKVVNTPINAISNESPSHLADKMKRLKSVLDGEMIALAGKQVSINDQPEGKAMAYEFIAQKLVLQGAQQVSSNHKSAFAVATVALFLWSEYPGFGDVLLSHFYKRCPLLVPYYIPRLENQTKEEYFNLLGYDINNGVIEEEDKYLKKLSGLVRLYGAIVHSSMPPGVKNQQVHPHGIQFAWYWLASILNLQPRPTITATILFDFLEVCGYSLMETFKKQFQKLLHILCKDFIPKIDAVTPADQKGPVSRLKDFLEKGIKIGRFPPPEGQLTSVWWRS